MPQVSPNVTPELRLRWMPTSPLPVEEVARHHWRNAVFALSLTAVAMGRLIVDDAGWKHPFVLAGAAAVVLGCITQIVLRFRSRTLILATLTSTVAPLLFLSASHQGRGSFYWLLIAIVFISLYRSPTALIASLSLVFTHQMLMLRGSEDADVGFMSSSGHSFGLAFMQVSALLVVAGVMTLFWRDHEMTRAQGKQNGDLLTLLAETTADAVVLLDSDRRIAAVSDQIVPMTGRQPGELLGLEYTALFDPLDRRLVAGAWYGDTSAGPTTLDARVSTQDGQPKWSCTQLTGQVQLGRSVGRLLVLRDITERKDAEQAVVTALTQAQAANAAKNEFLSRMSHELRTPLAAVINLAQLVAEEREDDQELREDLGRIESSGKHLLRLVNDVLDLTRVDSGNLRLKVAPLALAPLAQSVVCMIEPLSAAADVKVSVDVRGLVARADARLLHDALLNLVANAVKYNRPGGTVHVRATRSAGWLELTVSDTGVGIEQDDLVRLFNPFERLSAEFGPVEGTGLGLAVVKRYVQAMGGSVEAASTVGVGSTFTVRLPAARGNDNITLPHPVRVPTAGSQVTIATRSDGREQVLPDVDSAGLPLPGSELAGSELPGSVATVPPQSTGDRAPVS